MTIKQELEKYFKERLSQKQEAQNKLIEKNKQLLDEKYPDLSEQELSKRLGSYLEIRSQHVKSFNNALRQPNKEYKPITGTYPVVYNKVAESLEEVLNKTKTLIEYQKIKEHYDNAPPISGIAELGKGFWGTGSSTDFTTYLVSRIEAATTEFTQMPYEYFSNSPIVYHVPLTEDVLTILGDEYKSNSCVVKYKDCQFLRTPHNGYAFGGYRTHPQFFKQNLDIELSQDTLVNDCSSLVNLSLQNIGVNLDENTTTGDWIVAHRILSKSDYHVPSDWEKTSAKAIVENFIAIVDPNKERLQPGDIGAFKTFNPQNTEEKSIGIGGHVMVVNEIYTSPISQSEEKKSLFFSSLESNRDRPSLEGEGIMLRPLFDLRNVVEPKGETKKVISYLRLRG